MPTWSVVITTRNRSKMLARALESCLAQTTSCEIVVVDEASTDGTQEMMKAFPQIKYIRNEVCLGHGAAVNIGTRAAKGEWIKPLDDDDFLADDCLTQLSNAIELAKSKGYTPTLVTGRAINCNEKGDYISSTRAWSSKIAVMHYRDLLSMMLLDQAPIGTPVQVGYSRQLAINCRGWNEGTRESQFGDEVEFWIKMAAHGNDVVIVPSYVGYRTVWPGSSLFKNDHLTRYRNNVSLKDDIREMLDGKQAGRSIRSYMALHWMILAARDRNYSAAARLSLGWLAAPWSVVHLLRRGGMKDMKKRLKVIG
jgi:glycosyltransferase involved in cell wall biosynthesis